MSERTERVIKAVNEAAEKSSKDQQHDKIDRNEGQERVNQAARDAMKG